MVKLIGLSHFERILKMLGTVSAAFEIPALVNTGRRIVRASGELPRSEHKQ